MKEKEKEKEKDLEKNIIRHVPDMVVHPTSSRVREDDWGSGHPERVLHGEPEQGSNVRKINDVLVVI